ncbi:hypothetical protein [Magnetococcus sp. PR-3]|uniref:hypothetical protein n=1 Tax=Magnetococcus sp. PR-3 TaxID=3120355 RepID=UPI002FCE36F6
MMSNKERKERIAQAFEQRVTHVEQRKFAILGQHLRLPASGLLSKAMVAKVHASRLAQFAAKRLARLQQVVMRYESKAQRQKRAQETHRANIKAFDAGNLWKEPDPLASQERVITAQKLQARAQHRLIQQRKLHASLIPLIVTCIAMGTLWMTHQVQELGTALQEDPISFMQWEEDHPVMGHLVRYMYEEKNHNRDKWKNMEQFVQRLK